MSATNGHRRIDDVLALLTGVHQGTKGFIAFCPAHEDRKKKSLSIGENEKGDVLVKCFAGCATESVCAALGITQADLFADSDRQLVSRSSRRPESYVYRDADGTPAYKVKRTKDKEFYPYAYDRSREEFARRAGLNGTGRVLYHLDELTHNTSDTIYWVEGEKDADRLRKAGLLATTAAGGAEGTLPDLKALAGREIIIVPDNDPPGRSYGVRVAKALAGIAASVKWLELPGLPAKGDVSDFFDAGVLAEDAEAMVEEFVALAAEAPEYDERTHGTEKPIRPARKGSSRRDQGRGKIGHDELQERWQERFPGMAWDGADWYRYGRGTWSRVSAQIVETQIVSVLKDAKDEGVEVTGHLMGSVLRIARAEVFVEPEQWDASPDILVCANGTLEISARTLREHRPEDHATNGVPFDYDPDARAEMFTAVLSAALSEETSYLQEFAGYCLTPDTSLETAVWLKGPRGSGKSTVIEGFQAMLGPKHGVLGLAEIESSPFALAKIPGKTLLTSTEQPASYLKSTHVIDTLISGETLLVDRKYRDAEYVKPTAKVMWAMNEAPRVGNAHAGIFRRVNIVSFPPLEAKRDPVIKEAIKEEGAGILNWALDGLSRLNERGGFDPPASVKAATEEWERSNDLVAMFVDEMCLTGSEYEVAARPLYNAFKEWAFEGGHKPASINRVGEDWKRLGFKDKRTMTGRFWTGVQLKTGL